MSTAPTVEEIREVLKRNLDLSEVEAYLFGSRATGRAKQASDWDIGLLAKDRIDHRTLARIRSDFDEMRTLHRFDVVDFSAVSAEFLNLALQSAKRL
ncbi:MAG: nucleotidyltransferase domain-containing protein [Verrucomicrobia bacterium]|nr:nucleotidyltransferase domain-containing protein [Verrucomicrobiota bacterium]